MQTVDAVPPPTCRRKVPSLALPPDPAANARKALRRAARTARTAFVSGLAAPVRRGLETALAANILPHLGPPGVLGCFAAIGDEIDPAALEQAARAAGWETAFPRVTADGPLVYHAAAFDQLAPGYRGISEPPQTLPIIRPDVVLVPLVAADRAGHRLGQGGGHYDRTLAALRAQGPLFAIGLAWDMQIMADIPAQPWDEPLDAIATPTAFHHIAHAARGRT